MTDDTTLQDLSVRESILRTAIDFTTGDRDVEYGDPVTQLGQAGYLKQIVRQFNRDNPTARRLSFAEWDAIDMILEKLSRLICGGMSKRDTYIDVAAYAAIAGECMERERDEQGRHQN